MISGNPALDALVAGVGSSEEIAAYKQLGKNVAPGLLSNIFTSNKQQGAAAFVPGAAAGIYSLADLLNRGGQYVASKLGGYETSSWRLPGAATSDNIVDETLTRARDFVGVTPPDPGNLAENVGASMGVAIGSMGLAGLPSGGSKLAKTAYGLFSPASLAKTPQGATALYSAAGAIGGILPAAMDGVVGDRLKALDAASPAGDEAPIQLPSPAPAPPTASPALPTEGPVQLPSTADGPVQLPQPVMNRLPSEKIASLTGTTYGDIAIATAAGIGILAGSKVAIGLLRRSHVADFEAVTRQATQDQAAVRAGSPTMQGRQPTQPPLPGVSRSDRIVAQTVDNSVPLQRVIEAVAPDVATGQRLSAQAGNLANEGGFAARMQSFVDSGYDPKASRRYASIGDQWRDVSRTSDVTQQKYSTVIAYRDELDNRRALKGLPHNFPELDTPTLHQRIAAIMADAEVTRLIQQRRVVTDGVPSWLVDRGMLTVPEAAKLRNAHPGFLPSANEHGLIDNPLASRNLVPFGGESSQTLRAWEADKQHIEALFRAVENNDRNNIVIKSLLDYQERNPKVAKFVELMTGSGLPNAGGNTANDVRHITVRNAGVLQNYRVHSSELWDFMDGIGQRLYIPIANETKQLMQSATTGPLGWIVGNFPAPALAGYNGMVGAITRSPGTRFGYIDAAMQSLTKGRFGWPGDASGIVVGQPLHILDDGMSAVANGLAVLLEPRATNPLNKAVRAVVGNKGTNFISANLKARWEASQLFERKALGISGSGGLAAPDVSTAARFGIGPANSADKLNNMYPDLFRRQTRLPIGNSMPFFVKIGEIARTVNSVITDSASAHFYALNKGRMPTEQLVRETRRIAGDVGEIGSNQVAQAINQSIPYATPIIQGGRRVLSQVAAHPLSTTVGMTNIVLMSSLAAVFSSMLFGEATMDHLVNEMNSDRASGTINIYTSSDPETGRVVIPVESSMRGPHAVASSFIHDFFRIMYDSGQEGKQAALTALSEIFSKYVTTTSADEMITGAANMFTPGLPPVVEAVVGGAGVQLPNDWIARTIMGDRVWTSTDVKRQIPGIVDNVDPLTGGAINKGVFAALSAFGGAASTAISNILGAGVNAHRRTDSLGDALSAAGGAWIQNFGDSSRTGILWGQRSALPMRMGFVEQVERKMQAIQETAGANTAINLQGTMTRQGGEPVNPGMGMESKLPTDPQMNALYRIVGSYASVANKEMQPATDAKKQIDTLRSSGLPPQEQRRLINEQVRLYQERMTRLSDYLNTMEQLLGERTGKQIVLEQIDWKGTFTQFRDLPAK